MGSFLARLEAAREVPPAQRRTETESERLRTLLTVSEELDNTADLDSLLDLILSQARSFTSADAGTIYLIEGDRLRISYNSQSGRLTAGDGQDNRSLYLDLTIPMDRTSIAGYVAVTGETLSIADAYALGNDVPYRFNRAFDEEVGYRTVSMLTVPLKTNRGKTVGVLQLINALDPDTDTPLPFRDRDKLYVSLFAKNAAVAIERASLTRLIILRMIRMAQLRDPTETGAHVNRVAAYSIEIYERWAQRNRVPSEERLRNKDLLRLGAMLHDVGKIAIPDAILKKPGRLTDEERHTMQLHAVYGARLFAESESEFDAVAREIILNHHERWDGGGYPGKIDDLMAEPVTLGKGKAGEEIPLFGRIVALADVYDALVSRRAYKEAWTEEKVFETLQEEAGYQFDPTVVELFFEIYQTITAIRGRYSD
jgi:HD-GYP domain-containing protein (c-di-GMP phosphodiesterase class II)